MPRNLPRICRYPGRISRQKASKYSIRIPLVSNLPATQLCRQFGRKNLPWFYIYTSNRELKSHEILMLVSKSFDVSLQKQTDNAVMPQHRIVVIVPVANLNNEYDQCCIVWCLFRDELKSKVENTASLIYME